MPASSSSEPTGAVDSDLSWPGTPEVESSLPAVRLGLVGGVVGLLCCVGPTVLALLGLVSAATAVAWANDLYDGYTWWFRITGLLVMAGLVSWILLRRRSCSLSTVWSLRGKLVLMLAVAVGAYLVLYVLTTWLEQVGS